MGVHPVNTKCPLTNQSYKDSFLQSALWDSSYLFGRRHKSRPPHPNIRPDAHLNLACIILVKLIVLRIHKALRMYNPEYECTIFDRLMYNSLDVLYKPITGHPQLACILDTLGDSPPGVRPCGLWAHSLRCRTRPSSGQPLRVSLLHARFPCHVATFVYFYT